MEHPSETQRETTDHRALGESNMGHLRIPLVTTALSLLYARPCATPHAGPWNPTPPEEKEKLKKGEAVSDSVGSEEEVGSGRVWEP